MRSPRGFARYLVVFLALLTLTACATSGKQVSQGDSDTADTVNIDPWEPFNRGMYRFNDALDRAVLRPVARGYVKVLPQGARTVVGNFFNNLREPTTIVNDLLQGKFQQALHDTFRFSINTSLGLVGLIDLATVFDVPRNEEDFGQTFAKWGIADGPYLVLPFFGPSNVRDAVGLAPQFFYTDPILGRERPLALYAVRAIDTRATLLGADRILEQQLDPYVFLRESYRQKRLNQIYDGNPPQTESISDEELFGTE